VRGALVEAGKPLFTVADGSVMWAMLNIPEGAVGQVRLGQMVELRVESLPGKTFTGKLAWIAAEVQEKTRMARARAEVANPNGVAILNALVLVEFIKEKLQGGSPLAEAVRDGDLSRSTEPQHK
jgi:multidrug efflux pump subunit AcrA (membrane-fusion protein)